MSIGVVLHCERLVIVQGDQGDLTDQILFPTDSDFTAPSELSVSVEDIVFISRQDKMKLVLPVAFSLLPHRKKARSIAYFTRLSWNAVKTMISYLNSERICTVSHVTSDVMQYLTLSFSCRAKI